MNLSEPFVRRPVATVLLTIGLALSGIAAYFVLPVAPLPQVEFPTISVSARLPGASRTPWRNQRRHAASQRRLGTIAGVNEMTSSSGNGSTRVSLQFDLNRSIDAAARECRRRSTPRVPTCRPRCAAFRPIAGQPAASPIIILALTSQTRSPGQVYEDVSNISRQKVAQGDGVGDVELGGGSLPAVRVELLPFALNRLGVSMEDVRAAIQSSAANRPKGVVEGHDRRLQIYTGQALDGKRSTAVDYRSLVIAWRGDAPVRLGDVANVYDGVEDTRTLGLFNASRRSCPRRGQPDANVIETVDGVRALLRNAGAAAGRCRAACRIRSHETRFVLRCMRSSSRC